MCEILADSAAAPPLSGMHAARGLPVNHPMKGQVLNSMYEKLNRSKRLFSTFCPSLVLFYSYSAVLSRRPPSTTGAST
jgi:hypothetical protein